MSDPSKQIPYWFRWILWTVAFPAIGGLVWWIIDIEFDQHRNEIRTQQNRERIERNYELIREDFLEQIRNKREEIEKTSPSESN